MLTIVMALQGRQASKDWHRVSQLCDRTLRSACAQTHPDFRVVLVHHEKPDTTFRHPRLEFVDASHLPVPRTPAERMPDKWTKLKLGLVAVRDTAPFHLLLADADDCISRELAGWCARHAGHPGWFFDQGFQWDEGSRLIFHHGHRFDERCGTSHLLHCERSDLPASAAANAGDFEVLAFGHGAMTNQRAAGGRPLAALPFPGAVYVTGTGENDSGFSLRGWRSRRVFLQKLLHYRLLTAGRRREFGLLPLGVHSTA